MKGGTPLHYHFICILPDDCIYILKYILSHPDFIWNHHNTHEETPMLLAQDLLKLELRREKILMMESPFGLVILPTTKKSKQLFYCSNNLLPKEEIWYLISKEMNQ
jgi:hypothetical protein